MGLSFVVPAENQYGRDRRCPGPSSGWGRGHRWAAGRTPCAMGRGKQPAPNGWKLRWLGITGLTTDDQYGTPEHERYANRRDFQPNPINAVVVRQWNGKDYGPGGKTVFLTNAPVEKPLQVFDDYDDRSLIENCCIKACKQQWDLGHPPQKTERAVQVHGVFTRLMFALATAYRLQCEREAVGM